MFQLLCVPADEVMLRIFSSQSVTASMHSSQCESGEVLFPQCELAESNSIPLVTQTFTYSSVKDKNYIEQNSAFLLPSHPAPATAGHGCRRAGVEEKVTRTEPLVASGLLPGRSSWGELARL